jgi:hypothetical protein
MAIPMPARSLFPIWFTAVAAAGLAPAAGCTDDIDAWNVPAPDPFAELERLQREGPPRYASRVHSCPKMRYRTLGNLLASRGVDLAATGELTAGQLYRQAGQALGGPNYAARVRENLDLGLATTAKLFDIYVQAAPEIIQKLPARPECQLPGAAPGAAGAAKLFDADNHCVADGVTCLIGVPATPTHLEICNQTVRDAADVETGKRLAVAVLAAAAHTCE